MDNSRQKMEKVLEFLRQDLASLKVGRATPALIERIVVEAYGSRMPLLELATIAVADMNQLVVTPFDQNNLKAINQALALNRGLGLSPIVEENAIRLKIAPLTEERRQELVKVVSQKLEAARIMIRQVRGEILKNLRQDAQTTNMSKDELFQKEKELQTVTDEFNQKILRIGQQKEQELISL